METYEAEQGGRWGDISYQGVGLLSFLAPGPA